MHLKKNKKNEDQYMYLWKKYLSLIYGNPVGCREPLVIFNVVDAVLQVAKPLRQVHLEQISQQIF